MNERTGSRKKNKHEHLLRRDKEMMKDIVILGIKRK